MSGEEDGRDGDNINVVIRVRPISNKEAKNHDASIIQFPGEGQIWVRAKTTPLHTYLLPAGGRGEGEPQTVHLQCGVRAGGHAGGCTGA